MSTLLDGGLIKNYWKLWGSRERACGSGLAFRVVGSMAYGLVSGSIGLFGVNEWVNWSVNPNSIIVPKAEAAGAPQSQHDAPPSQCLTLKPPRL